MTLQERTFAIDEARIVPIEAEPFTGRVLVRDGRIEALGPRLDVPADVPIVPLPGRWVLPGLVDAHTHLGSSPQDVGQQDADINERALSNAAGMRAIDSINPADAGFDDALAGGVTTVCVMPGSLSPIGGRAVTLHTWGDVVDEMVMPSAPALKMAMGENAKREHALRNQVPVTRMGIAYTIRASLMAARDYAEAKRAAAASGAPFRTDPALEPLVDLLEGRMSVRAHSHRADDIMTAVRLAEEFGYGLTIEHGTQAHLVADRLAAHGVPVVTGSFMDARPKVELRHKTTRGPGILDAAGVRVAISTDHPVLPIQHLIVQVILAVRDGLDRDRALEAITITPARILGVDDRVGSLAPGKLADLVAWTGDPLDAYSRPESVWVEGGLAYTHEGGRRPAPMRQR